MLDACRDNPFGWSRSGTRGLSVVSMQPHGSIIVYATSAGSTAQGGAGRNGVFTAEYLNNLETPGWRSRTCSIERGKTVYVAFAYLPSPIISVADIAASLVPVEGGTFKMGSEDGDSDERPVHTVTVSSLSMSKCETTFARFDAFCDATGWKKPRDEGRGRGNRPVINVTGYDAVEYCNWLSLREGLTPCYSGSGESVRCNFSANGYRHPTEAEWEYAAKGGNRSRGY